MTDQQQQAPAADAPIPQSYADREAEIVRLRQELADAQAAQAGQASIPPATDAQAAQAGQASIPPATDASATATIGVAAPKPEDQPTPPGAQQVATHAIGPGSSGEDVQQLAQLVEQAGEKTYLSDPAAQNPAHVFTDDLMEAVRRVLHDHPEISAVSDNAEQQRLNRWISGLELVTAEVWGLLSQAVSAKESAAA